MSQCFDSVHYSIYLVKVGLGPCQKGHLAYINKLGYLGLRMCISTYLSIYLPIFICIWIQASTNTNSYAHSPRIYVSPNNRWSSKDLACKNASSIPDAEQSMDAETPAQFPLPCLRWSVWVEENYLSQFCGLAVYKGLGRRAARTHRQETQDGESGFQTPLSEFPEGLEPRACGVVAA